MSETYEIKALSKKGDTLELNVTIVHPDIDELPDAKNFALQLLLDAGNREGPLTKEISNDQRFDEKWMKQNAHRFIKAVKILSKKNHPRGGLSALQDDDGGDEPAEEPQPTAVYRVKVVNEKHIAKIKPNSKWDTASYDYGPDLDPK
jgi:hypothetical protein